MNVQKCKYIGTKRLLLADHEKRLAYANFVIEQATADNAFWHSIIMMYEVGAMNSPNYRYYSEKNSQIIHKFKNFSVIKK